jgi:hypothetical protein
MGNIKPRFTSTCQPEKRNHKHPNGYLTPLLKRWLKKKFNIENPETQKIIKMTGADGVMLRLVWNALQGENEAIKTILERFDGKVKDKLEVEGNMTFTQMPVIKKGKQKKDFNVGD